MVDPEKLTVAKLKAELKKLGLDQNGLKAALVARLKEALTGAGNAEEAPAPTLPVEDPPASPKPPKGGGNKDAAAPKSPAKPKPDAGPSPGAPAPEPEPASPAKGRRGRVAAKVCAHPLNTSPPPQIRSAVWPPHARKAFTRIAIGLDRVQIPFPRVDNSTFPIILCSFFLKGPP